MGVSLDSLYAEANRQLLYNDSSALAILSEDDRKELIKSAVKVYSVKRPRLVLQVYTGQDDNWYDLPTSWEEGFSSIKEIEYPVENSPPDYIANKDYKISLMDTGKKIRFIQNNPTLAETFWVKYRIQYTFDSSNDSLIPDTDQTVLTWLILSIWCDAFAVYYASKANPIMSGVEVIAQPSRVEEYTGKAKDYLTKYLNALPKEYTGLHGGIGFLQDTYFDRDDE